MIKNACSSQNSSLKIGTGDFLCLGAMETFFFANYIANLSHKSFLISCSSVYF